MTDQSIKISLIITVYNNEKVLKRCIENAKNQTYKNIEILLIDDGSNDGSAQICDSYLKIDDRIKVFHKPNGGVSSARNLGLTHASGDYVCFIDSDDFVEPNQCAQIVKAVVNADLPDMVLFGYNKIIENKKRVKRLKTKQILETSIEMFDKLCAGHWSVVVWNKAYKRDAVKYLFNEKFITSEDLLFNAQFFVEKHRIVVLQDVLYNYVYEPNLINTKRDRFKIKENIEVSKELYNMLDRQYGELSHINTLILKNIIKNFCCNAQMGTESLLEQLNNEDYCNELRTLLKNAKTKNLLLKIIIFLLKHKKYKLFIKLVNLKFK